MAKIIRVLSAYLKLLAFHSLLQFEQSMDRCAMIKSRISLHPWIIRIICKITKKKIYRKIRKISKVFATNLRDKTNVCLNSVSLVSLVKSIKLHRILRNCSSVHCAIFQCTIMFIKLYLYCIHGTKQKKIKDIVVSSRKPCKLKPTVSRTIAVTTIRATATLKQLQWHRPQLCLI